MAFRSRATVLLQSAAKSESVIAGEGGFRGLVQRVKERLSTGKLLRPDLEDDVLRKPVAETGYRYPSPGAQHDQPIVPQGDYQNVFNITYHNRDSRRRAKREQVVVDDTNTVGLPPTPGTPAKHQYLGMLGDFDRQK